MADETPTGPWQDSAVDALRASGGENVILMLDATGWAMLGNIAPFYVVLVAGEGSQSLKVCMAPLSADSAIVEALTLLAARPTGPQCFFLGGDFDAVAFPDTTDERSFYYEVTSPSDATLIMAAPCRGYRFRDHCRDVDL